MPVSLTTDGVLREKLRAPEVGGLARGRLETPLVAGSRAGLAVVVAAAGSGKTTLLSRVAAAATVPVGWYRVTADDTSERRFVAHLAAALSTVADTPHVDSMRELLGCLDNWRGPAGILVLDDLHEIAETPAEKLLERFISLRPRALRLIFGSRRMPDINVPRLRVSGSYHEITGDDLRFRSWEVEELFASVYGQPLRPEAAAVLTRRTGGWAAGLQLFHLATVGRGSAERHQAVADLGGRSKLVRSYLTRNVLADLPEDRREFLLHTCTLGRLSGEACDTLLGTHGSHRILEELEAAQLFTVTDDGSLHFRYHEVLQTHLELALVEEYGSATARSWYSRSAGVLESLGELRAATRAYAKAGDWVSVSRLLQETGESRIDASVADDVHLLSASTWRQDPWLALANARRLVREGALQRAGETYRHAQSLYDDPNYQQICRSESTVVSMWLPSSRTASGHLGAQHWSGYLRDAMCKAPNLAAPMVRATTDNIRERLVYGLAALVAGETELARQVLAAIPREESSDALATISATLAITTLDLLAGGDVDPVSHFSTIASLAESEGLPWISRLSQGLGQLTLLASGKATWRFESCSDMVRAAEQAGDSWGAALLSFAVGVALQQLGAVGVAQLTDAADRFADLGAPVLELWARLWAMREDPTEVETQRAVSRSRQLRMRGAEAWALSMSASVPKVGNDAAAQSDNDSSPAVAITCLGDYSVTVDGHPVDVASLRPQARAVLHILSLSPNRDSHREHLEEILWPGVDHSVACHRLQVAVSSVRTLFGSSGVMIRRSGESYRLSLPAGATVDVCDFERLLAEAGTLSARGDLAGRVATREKALALYSGDLLPGITSEYVDAERDRLRRSAAAAAAALAADFRTLGDYERAANAAQRSVQSDPYQEISWSILADLYEKVGDVGSAEYVRREHGRVKAELEVSGR